VLPEDQAPVKKNSMILLDSAPIADGGGEIGLYQHGDDMVIKVVGGQTLMSTRSHGSEEALARIACAELAGRERTRVLIGGMGMGFTIASALHHLAHDAEVVVAELVPAVIEWNRGPPGDHSGHPIRDERVTIHAVDVAILLRGDLPVGDRRGVVEPEPFDAILLDVDNGPEGLTQEGNHWLYSKAGLEASYRALRPSGVLAVWSADQDHAFSKRLRRTGFEVKQVPVRARGRKGGRHFIWIARTREQRTVGG